jgi:hypothetical protein
VNRSPTTLAVTGGVTPRFHDDGTVSVVLQRTGAGRLSEAGLGAVAGLPIFWPETAEARRVRGVMPQPPTLLAGEVLEAGHQGGALVGRLAVVDKLASLLRRLPGRLQFVRRGDFFEVTTGSGATGADRAALVEAAVESDRSKAMAGMTLVEALRTPEVVEHLRHELGLAERSAPAVARVPEQSRAARLLEAVSQPVEQAPVVSPVLELMRRRGLNPAHFGMGGDAA